jgi:hypothetical protein
MPEVNDQAIAIDAPYVVEMPKEVASNRVK